MKRFAILLALPLFLVACSSKLPSYASEGEAASQGSLNRPVSSIMGPLVQGGNRNALDKNVSSMASNTNLQPLLTGSSNAVWNEIPFDDLAPRGINLKECWNAMGIDDLGRIYIGFTSSRTDGRDDFAVFRYDPKTSERRFLGSFLNIVAAAGNALAGENIPKGHTRMLFVNGRMYMGSQNFHDLKAEIDSLPTYRGSHLFAFDTIGSLWKDLSAALPGGVITAHEGIISLNIMPNEHLLVGLAHPSSDIVLYDYLAEQLVKVVSGIPWKLGNPLSRESIVAPSGNIYTYRGTEAVNQQNETHSVWVYNIHTGEMKDTGFNMTRGFWVGQTQKRDGSKIYINTIGGELYEFDVAAETFKDLGYELPRTDNRIIDYTYSLTLSPDERRIYYVLSIIQKPGGAIGDGNGGSGQLYYYDIATGQVVFAQQLPVGIYTSADLRDSQNIYFAHFGNDANLWTGNPRLLILHVPSSSFAKIDLYPNIETVGVVVSGANLPNSATLMYRQVNETTWRTGHPLVRINDGRLTGSLFGLSQATSYEIKVVDGANEISGSTTTQPKELQFTPSAVLHVNANAPAGGDGSASAPFQTIQAGVNLATPGTQVLVADGIYHETVSFPASGSAGNWIQVKAEGNGAILDGSQTLSGKVWTPYDSYSHVWYTKISGPIGYLARDGSQRFYNYDTLSGLLNGSGHNKVSMNEGWFLQPYTWRLYVRSLDNPARHNWQVPQLNHAFDANGQNWLWIEGFEMRFYGTRTDGCGVCTVNASHVVIRRNKIHNMQLGIYVNWNGGDDQGNDTRIEYNEIYDPPVNEWPWKAVKGSSMEGTTIVIRGHIGAIVRDNELHNFNNGIYIGSSAALKNPAVAFDVDIYNNHIHHISDDALEPEGTCINLRLRNNLVDSTLTGVSLAPITSGPVWVLRSLFTNFTGTSIKWDLNTSGIVFIYHNTSWTNVKGLNAMTMISPAHNVVMRNNIFQGNGYAIEAAATGSTSLDWNNDNWYTTRSLGIPHFKWENIRYNTLSNLCSSTGLECKGYETPPGLTNPGGGDFTLLPSSPNVDRGVVIPGINDNFAGKAPDVGALESGTNPSPSVSSSARADANPTNASSVNFTVTFSEPVSGVDTAAPFNDFGLTSSPGITGASIAGVASVSGSIYTVNVNTGSGNGTLRLDVIDNDSISNSGGQPLGGAGASNGNFNGGEEYIINKGLPTATGIVRMDPNPTVADSVIFKVTFSEQVNGVDPGDFSVFTTGQIAGAKVSGVNGSGNLYTVAVDTGTGDGTLRLSLVDDDSIMDAAGNRLGGAGAGNGSFSTGEAYTINKSVINKVTETFTSGSLNDGWILESGMNSGQGGSIDSTSTTFYLGDNARDQQFRAILDFNTTSLPDNAVITSVTLKIKKLSVTGVDPFTTHQNILIDIRAGNFGASALQASDFQAPASRDAVGMFMNTPVGDWYSAALDKSGLPFLNKFGPTQLRLGFQMANNQDQGADTIKFYSGDELSRAYRPTLIVEYYVP